MSDPQYPTDGEKIAAAVLTLAHIQGTNTKTALVADLYEQFLMTVHQTFLPVMTPEPVNLEMNADDLSPDMRGALGL